MWWGALSWQLVTLSFESQFAVQGSQFPIWKEANFKTFLKALNISFFGIMEWDVKALSDLYELARQDIDELLLGFFSRRLPLDLNLGIFSVCPLKNKKSQLFTYLGSNSIRICLFGVISFAMMYLNYILNRTC